MRKTLRPVAPLLICLVCLLSGCARLPSLPSWSWLPPYEPPEAKETRSITELWEPVYEPDFAFEPYHAQSDPDGYTVGIIDLEFSYESVPQGEWVMTPLEEKYRKDFIDAFSRGLKKILMGEGMEVRGPFLSYDDMTFTERSKCDFVIRPKLSVELQPTRSSTLIEELPGYGGPYGEPFVYGRSQGRLEARARLEYEIIDPRTRRQLGWHMLESDTISKSYEQLWSQWTMTYGRNSRTGWHVLEYNPKKYPNYHNAENATGKALEDIYHGFMPRITSLVSAGEFKLLDEQKRESKNRRPSARR